MFVLGCTCIILLLICYSFVDFLFFYKNNFYNSNLKSDYLKINTDQKKILSELENKVNDLENLSDKASNLCVVFTITSVICFITLYSISRIYI